MTTASRIEQDERRGTMRRLYYVNPLLVSGREAWAEVFAHARDLGFDSILSAPLFARGDNTSVFVARSFDAIDPIHNLGSDVGAAMASLADAAREMGLDFLLDLVIDRMAGEGHGLAADPRISPQDAGSRRIDFSDGEESERQVEAWRRRIATLVEAGVGGFRCLGVDRIQAAVWKQLVDAARVAAPSTAFLAWTPGSGFDTRRALRETGIDGTFSSLAWWNMREGWLIEEHDLQRSLGIQVAFPEAPFGHRVAHGTESCEILRRKAVQALKVASGFDALMVPMGFEFGAAVPLDPMHGDGQGIRGLRDRSSFDLSSEIRSVNESMGKAVDQRCQGPLRLLPASQSPVVALLQTEAEDPRSSEAIRITLVNRDLRKQAAAPMKAIGEVAADFLPLKLDGAGEADAPERLRLLPGELRILTGQRARPILGRPVKSAMMAGQAARLAIENITPAVDGGQFPVKRVVGQTVTVEADIFGDSHDPLSAALFWREGDNPDWHEVPMELVENDRWRADFPLTRLGRHEYAVEAWRNPFAVYRYELGKKHEARLDLKLEIQEGIELVHDAILHAKAAVIHRLQPLHDELQRADETSAAALLLSAELFGLMAEADLRPFRVRSQVIPVDAERSGAAFASWYQLFPRSQSGDPHRHGTFDDVIGQLTRVKAMGFDVLYFPPIHPIGTTNRKGRNNSLKAAPDDPGSPYAIGSPEGGHDAIHAQLGTFDDFRRLVAVAREHGIEIALDLAIQASPDHPWLKERPGWFAWRPDGTIRYAENPPKKYEDIVNVDFYARDAVPELWTALRDIVQLWVDQGVKLFRVDNPHTKPFPFWEWLIADIRARHPEVIFLSEAFTRPKVMYRLAKVGFSQSYTYFTWRNTRGELEEYLTELTTQAPKDFFRPHFFVNTHDINPDFLQNAPRSAYMIRAALAATLSGLWGVYNGFELCEGRPDVKRKEYADSEKYEIRAWDWDRPGNIIREITLLNRIRRENAALHSHLGLTFLPSSNPDMMFYEKASTGRENVLLVAVNLDPHHEQESHVEVPLWRWNLPDHGAIELDDLVSGGTLTWHGKWQTIRLNPHIAPFSIYRVR